MGVDKLQNNENQPFDNVLGLLAEDGSNQINEN